MAEPAREITRAAQRRAARRSHPKSRTGCKTCKSRKIKCDESKPACGNCIKHNVDCDFIEIVDSRPSVSPGPSHSLDFSTLELLHNFATRTFVTLSDNATIRDFYRLNTVQLGFKCEYIMRSVLALSALHLAYHRADMRDHYQSLAMFHHQLASREAMALMQNSDPSSAETLFLFSVLTIYFALASPRKNDGALFIEESGFPDWMFLLLGTREFMRIAGAQSRGPMAPLLRHGAERWLLRESKPEPVSQARRHLDGMRSSMAPGQVDPARRDIYLRAIEELDKSFSVFDVAGSDNCDIIDPFVWIFEVAEDLLPLLRIPTQEAVAIFAFFAVLIRRLEKQWWLKGWAEHLIAKSYSLLDEEHRLWIQWPMEETGWVP